MCQPMSGHQLGAVAGLLIALPVVVLLGTISQLSREPNAYKQQVFFTSC
jgi:hypothetical protein